MKQETVLVLGASDRPERYAYQALTKLRQAGHTVIPVHPKLHTIDDIPVVAELTEIEAGAVDTVTVYVNPSISEPLAEALIALKPTRVLLNPGTESAVLKAALSQAGILTEEACTLVLLATGQF